LATAVFDALATAVFDALEVQLLDGRRKKKITVILTAIAFSTALVTKVLCDEVLATERLSGCPGQPSSRRADDSRRESVSDVAKFLT